MGSLSLRVREGHERLLDNLRSWRGIARGDWLERWRQWLVVPDSLVYRGFGSKSEKMEIAG